MQSCPVENPKPGAKAGETLDQVLVQIKDETGRTEQQLADSIGVHVSTFNTWINGKAVPRQPSLLKLANRYPAYKRRLFEAAGKRTPAPLTADRRDVILHELDRLTEEQQESFLIQVRAVGDSNEGRT